MADLLADIGAPFFDTAKPFRNWSSLPYHQLDLPHAPYVDTAQLERGLGRALAHLAALHAQGYTGIVVDNLAHLVTLDGGAGPIYAEDDPCRLRAAIYQEALGRLFAAAAERAMRVYVTVDMQWATPAVRRAVGQISPSNPRLAELNQRALAELFERFPQVSGVFIRIGEAGGAHDQEVGYTGHLIYRSPHDLRRLIAGLLPICERHGRALVVRTWSIGIGEIGDLLWSPARYRAVFDGLTSPSLAVSVKHGPSDFFRLLPPNQTLGLPGPPQIIELQNRREYELFGMVPSSIAALHGRAISRALAAPQTAGIWAWNGTGGWGGGAAALGDTGWSLWTELSSALTAALARGAAPDPDAFVRGWCAARFGPGAAPFAEAVADLYRESADLIERGWYLGTLDRRRATVGRLQIPTLLWVWWARPTAAPLIWAYLAAAAQDVPGCVRDASEAARRAAWHAERLAARCPEGDQQAAWAVESARYLRDCLAISHAIREQLLPAAAAARIGDRAAWDAVVARAPAARAAIAAHRAAWGGRPDFPALELDEVEAYLRELARRPGARWSHARAAGWVVRRLIVGGEKAQSLEPVRAAAVAALALTAARSRWAPQIAAIVLAAALIGRGRGSRAGARVAQWACRRWFLLPSIFFEAGPDVTEWVA